jgi:hypothetical protein
VLALDVVQAAFGDCLIVRYETKRTRRLILVDGGPSGAYAADLRPHLLELSDAETSNRRLKIDLAVLSHIDNDHVKGLLDLFTELEGAGEDGRSADGQRLPLINELWHNTFSVSAGGADVAPRIRDALNEAAVGVAPAMRILAGTLMGVGEGDALRVAALTLGVPINRAFGGNSVLVDSSPSIQLGALRLDVVGPSTAILERLREEWLLWLSQHEASIAAGRRDAAVAADSSVPNLSSIVILVRAAGRSILLAGDGRGDQIVAGLEERGFLDPGGTMHVDLLKVPHHGSSRNATADFFRTVTADRYVISANGRYGNPDLECLMSIVDVAAGRPFELICTNQTDSLRALVRKRPPRRADYRITMLPPGEHAYTVELA